jgi:hypothetical protein
MVELAFEELKTNWETYESLCLKATKHGMPDLLENLGVRLTTCPASPRDDQYGAYAGGLVEHALKVTTTMRQLNATLDTGMPVKSILKVGLLHDLGKVGDLQSDYFVEQDSSWHREKLGQFYKYNENLNKMSVSHRTLYLLQHFGITINNDEWLAIQLAQGSHFEENRFYVGHEPTLGLLLQQAKQFNIHKVKNDKIQ